MQRDYYAVLGVATGATAVEIRRAYQRLARQYSPDVNLWEQEARPLFEEIAAAYRGFGGPLAGGLYDRQPGHAQGATAAEPAAGRVAGRRGDDLHRPVELSFRHALTGFEGDLTVSRLSPCGPCGATGTARGAVPSICAHCAGVGSIWSRGGAEPCPLCNGTGVRAEDPCGSCRGCGVTLASDRVHVVLPPDADTGAQFRVPGQGHSGPFGGPRGDLVIMARVHDDPVFTRKGDNLYCEARLTMVEAALGARVTVRTADESDLKLAVPPGTQSGRVFRVRGRGVPRLSSAGRGDLYVTARVEMPQYLGARAQALLRELAPLLAPLPGERTSKGSPS